MIKLNDYSVVPSEQTKGGSFKTITFKTDGGDKLSVTVSNKTYVEINGTIDLEDLYEVVEILRSGKLVIEI